MTNLERIDRLALEHDLPDEDLLTLLTSMTCDEQACIAEKARAVADRVYGKEVFLRGLIEISSYCKNDCYYCGIRRSNSNAERFRLTEEQILECAEVGYQLGFRTFVLQGGEDPWFTDERVCHIICALKSAYPDSAVTLSIGEKSRESYQKYYDAGADRYLLRHETSNAAHYGMLHPADLSIENRKRCLRDLKEIGYQVGAGIMVGAPYQTPEHILEDLRYLQELQPHMIGIGPFIPHQDTPFRDCPAGTLDSTLQLLSIIRLMFPDVLLPATTALGTIEDFGREMGIQAGANVIMPNLSPEDTRKKYLLYDGKMNTACDAADTRNDLESRLRSIGYFTGINRGDHI